MVAIHSCKLVLNCLPVLVLPLSLQPVFGRIEEVLVGMVGVARRSPVIDFKVILQLIVDLDLFSENCFESLVIRWAFHPRQNCFPILEESAELDGFVSLSNGFDLE